MDFLSALTAVKDYHGIEQADVVACVKTTGITPANIRTTFSGRVTPNAVNKEIICRAVLELAHIAPAEGMSAESQIMEKGAFFAAILREREENFGRTLEAVRYAYGGEPVSHARAESQVIGAGMNERTLYAYSIPRMAQRTGISAHGLRNMRHGLQVPTTSQIRSIIEKCGDMPHVAPLLPSKETWQSDPVAAERFLYNVADIFITMTGLQVPERFVPKPENAALGEHIKIVRTELGCALGDFARAVEYHVSTEEDKSASHGQWSLIEAGIAVLPEERMKMLFEKLHVRGRNDLAQLAAHIELLQQTRQQCFYACASEIINAQRRPDETGPMLAQRLQVSESFTNGHTVCSPALITETVDSLRRQGVITSEAGLYRNLPDTKEIREALAYVDEWKKSAQIRPVKLRLLHYPDISHGRAG